MKPSDECERSKSSGANEYSRIKPEFKESHTEVNSFGTRANRTVTSLFMTDTRTASFTFVLLLSVGMVLCCTAGVGGVTVHKYAMLYRH